MQKIKKLSVTLFLTILLLVPGAYPVLAIEAPSAPSAPEAPSAPSAPSAPAAPVAPEAPSAPQEEPEVTEVAVTTITNTDNGAGSTNTAEVSVSQDTTVVQTNTADIGNSVTAAADTGGNIASQNTGGNTAVVTADANVSGTIINSVNTNVTGTTVNQFDVTGDHTGDIVLTPVNATSGCTGGCVGPAGTITNTGNGDNSTNLSNSSNLSDSNTFQSNTATIGGTLVLSANSGKNIASQNTNGDTAVTTGDANVAGSALNFVNNNIVGGVIYNIVNIYGQLVGDIILPALTGVGNTGDGNNVTNNDNGADSTNSADLSNTVNSETFQNNSADLANNMVLTATTGNNQGNQNTNGDTYIDSGSAVVAGKTVNVANTNVAAGQTVWLVLVNEAGKWVGKILGAPEGTPIAASEGVNITNSGNGSGSYNVTNSQTTTNTTVVQDNLAKIVNSLLLSANTGGNITSDNTGGDSSIITGDARVIANIVNFVNNNIAGSGNLVVTVVNVFGSWLGDFVTPGSSKPAPPTPPGIGGDSGGEGNTTSDPVEAPIAIAPPQPYSPSPVARYFETQVMGVAKESVFKPFLKQAQALENTRKVIQINLAWLLLLLPLFLIVGFLLWRRRQAALASQGSTLQTA